MGTSTSNTGGAGGSWTGFKRNATAFAKRGGREQAGKALAGHVATMGGAAAATTSARSGIQTGRALGAFLAQSTGAAGLAGGLEAVGLGYLVGRDRFTVLSELVTAFAGTGSDLEAQAARNALLDVLDALLPEDETELDLVQLDADGVSEALSQYLAALIYNRAIPVIDERLTLLQNPQLARRRDRELRDYIDALVRLRMQSTSALEIDWNGQDGHRFVEAILRAVYDQLEEIE